MTSEDLPSGWRAVQLREVAEVALGKMLDRAKRTRGTALPYLRNANVRWDAFDLSDLLTMPFEDHELERYSVKPGDVFVCEGGEPGRAALWSSGDEAIKYQKALLRVRPGPFLHPRWLIHSLRHDALSGRLEEYLTGSTIKHFPREAALRYELPLPPLSEQSRIVEKIDALVAQVNTARERLTRVSEILRLFRQSVIAAACSGRLTEGWRIAHGLNGRPDVAEGTEPGPPHGWMSTTLGTLLREPLRNGHSARRSESGQGIRTLTLSAVTCGDFSSANTKLTVAVADKVSDLWLEPGDLLVERSNTPELVGTARLYRGPRHFAIFPDLLIRVRLNAEVLPEFAEIQLDSAQSHRYFIESAQGSAGSMPKIDQQVIANAPFVLPPIAEQRRIVETFRNLRAVADSIDRRAALSGVVAKRIPGAALARAFRGELGSMDTDDGGGQ